MRDFSFVGYNECFFDMIIFVLNKCIQCAVHGIILTGLYFDRHSGQAVIIINQIINLTLAAIVIIKEFMTVRDQFTGNNRFIHRTQIDTSFIIQHCFDVISVKNARKNTDIIQIKLQQILSGRFDQRECRIRNRLNIQCDTRADKIIEFIRIMIERLTPLILYVLHDNSFFLILHIRGNQIIDSANLQFLFIVIF